MSPDFSFENKLWEQKKQFVAGIDEVGRGALAGPVVVAAVVFPRFFTSDFLTQINDSKLVKPLHRIKLAKV